MLSKDGQGVLEDINMVGLYLQQVMDIVGINTDVFIVEKKEVLSKR